MKTSQRIALTELQQLEELDALLDDNFSDSVSDSSESASDSLSSL